MIRRMTASDVTAVAALEASTFSTPWHPATFRRLLERPGAELWVTEEDGDVVAYAVLWCILDEGELANIAVLPRQRGRGVGGRLLDHLVEVARARGVRRLFLEVRESNEQARKLYETRGFNEVGRRRDYYEKPREDARVLALDLGPETPP